MYRQNEMGMRVRLEPEKAAREIERAYRTAGCDPEQTAQGFGVHRRTLDRWISVLKLGDRLAEIKRTRKVA